MLAMNKMWDVVIVLAHKCITDGWWHDWTSCLVQLADHACRHGLRACLVQLGATCRLWSVEYLVTADALWMPPIADLKKMLMLSITRPQLTTWSSNILVKSLMSWSTNYPKCLDAFGSRLCCFIN